MVSANVFQEKMCIFLHSAEKSMFLACLQEKGEPPWPLGQNFCRMAGAVPDSFNGSVGAAATQCRQCGGGTPAPRTIGKSGNPALLMNWADSFVCMS